MKTRFKKVVLIIALFIFLLSLVFVLSERGDYYVNSGEKVNIEEIISGGITESEYIILKEQTGLFKSAICDILSKDSGVEELLEFQKQNFSKYRVDCRYMFFPVTKRETLKDENGNDVFLKFPPLKTGDILVTKSTHTLLFRHGHAGLVTCADTGEVLEAMMIGVNSDYNNIASWRNFPTVAVLRPKNLSVEEIKKVTDYANDKLSDIKYDIFSGIFGETPEENGKLKSTHCSHLVWSAYKSAGINIDSDGGLLVLPDDFLRSDELEVVWSYGIN